MERNMSVISTIEQLEALYGLPGEASLVKQLDHVIPEYAAFIEASPFVSLATCGPEGLDCSPRGDLPGFVRVHDRRTLMMPDRRGNNRADSLKNIIRDARVGLLFLVPGSGTTLRVNGRALISIDAELCASFAVRGQAGALGDRDLRRRRLFPVRARHPPLRASGMPARMSIRPRCRRPAASSRSPAASRSTARPMTASGRSAPKASMW